MILQGWLPVRAILRLVLLPSQIVAEPLRAAKGRGFTVTTAFPDPVLEQVVASETEVTVYVFAVAGLTLTVYGFAVMPFTVTGVIPSV